MNIATYNLRAGGRRGRREHWTRMIDVFTPDILLVQETHHPSHYLTPELYAANADRIHWCPARVGRWGSAIFA
jgi:exonuclease III